MAEKGKVVDITQDYLIVKMNRQEACAKCRACISGLMEKEMLIEAENRCNAQVDDWVEIDLEDSNFLKAVLIMYGIPFCFLLFGFLAGYYGLEYTGLSFPKETASFLLGIILMGLSFLWIKSKEEHWRKQKEYRPVARSVIAGVLEEMSN